MQMSAISFPLREVDDYDKKYPAKTICSPTDHPSIHPIVYWLLSVDVRHSRQSAARCSGFEF